MAADSRLRALADEFRKIDDAAVREFNDRASIYGAGLEARLEFAEGRLMHVSAVLYRALLESADE